MLQFKWIRTVQTKDWQKNLQITWFSFSEAQDLKKVLVENGIVVMSVAEIWQPIGNLYEVGVLSKDGDIVISIVFPVNWKIRDAFDYFIETFGIVERIKYIKPYGKEIEENKLNKILELLKKEKGLVKEKAWVSDAKTRRIKKEKELTLQEKLKKELLENVDEFIKEIEDFLPYTEAEFPIETKELKDLLGVLKKYRISTNLYKLSENYKKALELSEQLYDKYFEYQKQKENKLTTIKLISELEIVSEYKNYEKVKRAKTLEKVDAKEFSFPWYETLYYKIFWKVWVHLKLLVQEFLRKTEQKGIKYEDILLFLQFLIIFLILNYTLLIIYFSIQQDIPHILSGFYMVLMFSYFGMWLTLAKFFSEKNKIISVLLIAVGLISWKFIKYYFGL